MTGYAASAALADGFLAPGMELITKPFTVQALALRIREMIENSEHATPSRPDGATQRLLVS